MSLLDELRALSPEVHAMLGAIAAALVVLAIGVQRSARQMRAELHDAEQELVDARTGLLPRSALRVRLGAELAWAAATRTPLSIALLHVRGSRFTHATRTLRHAMREEEGAFIHGGQRVVVELWDTDPDAALVATRRLGDTLARAGHPVIEAGIACAPRDGADVETLIEVARRDLRPIDDPLAPGGDLGRDGRARRRGPHIASLAAQALTWFAAASLLLLVCWRLLPAAIDPILGGDAARTDRDLVIALITLVGLPIGAALVLASAWNQRRGRLPRSRPYTRAGTRTAALVTVLIAAPLAWGIHAPLEPADLTDGFGATLAALALMVFAVFHARQLVHLPRTLLAVLIGAGGVAAWACTDADLAPVFTSTGQLLFACALGAFIARHIERASWMLAVAAISAAIGAWTTTLDMSIATYLLGEETASDVTIPGLHTVTGPLVAGAPLMVTTTTALVLLAICLCWAHDWRLDLRWSAGGMLLAVWGWALTAELIGDALPLTPWIGGVMVVLIVARSLHLRGRVTAATPSSIEPDAKS